MSKQEQVERSEQVNLSHEQKINFIAQEFGQSRSYVDAISEHLTEKQLTDWADKAAMKAAKSIVILNSLY